MKRQLALLIASCKQSAGNFWRRQLFSRKFLMNYQFVSTFIGQFCVASAKFSRFWFEIISSDLLWNLNWHSNANAISNPNWCFLTSTAQIRVSNLGLKSKFQFQFQFLARSNSNALLFIGLLQVSFIVAQSKAPKRRASNGLLTSSKRRAVEFRSPQVIVFSISSCSRPVAGFKSDEIQEQANHSHKAHWPL